MRGAGRFPMKPNPVVKKRTVNTAIESSWMNVIRTIDMCCDDYRVLMGLVSCVDCMGN